MVLNQNSESEIDHNIQDDTISIDPVVVRHGSVVHTNDKEKNNDVANVKAANSTAKTRTVLYNQEKP